MLITIRPMLDPRRALQVQMMLDSNGTPSKLHGVAGRVINDPAQIVASRSGPDGMKILLPANLLSPPPFSCQFSLYPVFITGLRLGSRFGLCDAPRFLHLSRPARPTPARYAQGAIA